MQLDEREIREDSRKDDETMREDEISRYTADSDVLDMQDFKAMPEIYVP